ncbi:MAG: hypothetical protein QOK14_190, partial [Frankiaceae bacterium]|nr:hypothetical protein [Frankiaceae bacterium]
MAVALTLLVLGAMTLLIAAGRTWARTDNAATALSSALTDVVVP